MSLKAEIASSSSIEKVWIPRALSGGAILASLLLVIGFYHEILADLGPHSILGSTYEAVLQGRAHPASFSEFPILSSGLVLLFLTPVLRLILSILHFTKLKEYRIAILPGISIGFILFGIIYWSGSFG